jgi:hypothetical protein
VTYLEGVTQLADFLAVRGMPTDIAVIRREHVEAFLVDLPSRFTPATANNRYRCLMAFFKFLVEEGEISRSPMARMKPPMIPEQPPRVLSETEIKALLKARDGSGFAERRDKALILSPTSTRAPASRRSSTCASRRTRPAATSTWTARCSLCSARAAGRALRRSAQGRSRPSTGTSG